LAATHIPLTVGRWPAHRPRPSPALHFARRYVQRLSPAGRGGSSLTAAAARLLPRSEEGSWRMANGMSLNIQGATQVSRDRAGVAGGGWSAGRGPRPALSLARIDGANDRDRVGMAGSPASSPAQTLVAHAVVGQLANERLPSNGCSATIWPCSVRLGWRCRFVGIHVLIHGETVRAYLVMNGIVIGAAARTPHSTGASGQRQRQPTNKIGGEPVCVAWRKHPFQARMPFDPRAQVEQRGAVRAISIPRCAGCQSWLRRRRGQTRGTRCPAS
jgi:hypothetical protein